MDVAVPVRLAPLALVIQTIRPEMTTTTVDLGVKNQEKEATRNWRRLDEKKLRDVLRIFVQTALVGS